MIQANLTHFDVRLRALEKIESRITFLEEQDKGLRQSILEADRPGEYVSEDLRRLSEQIRGLQERLAAAQEQPASQVTKSRHHVRRGDTLYRIAKTYDISVDELLRLNGLTPNQLIHPGEKLFVSTATSR